MCILILLKCYIFILYICICNIYVYLLGMDLVEGGWREFGFLGLIMCGDILGLDCC